MQYLANLYLMQLKKHDTQSNLKPPALRKFSQKDFAQLLAMSSSAVGMSLELKT